MAPQEDYYEMGEDEENRRHFDLCEFLSARIKFPKKVESSDSDPATGTSRFEYDDDETVPVSQSSRERGLNIGYRFPKMGSWLADLDRRESGARRRHENNGSKHKPKSGSKSGRRDARYESHCPKYGRQDYRHQLPRREAKAERKYAQYERMMEAYYAYWNDISNFYPELEVEGGFITVRQQLLMISTIDPDYLEECRIHEEYRNYLYRDPLAYHLGLRDGHGEYTQWELRGERDPDEVQDGRLLRQLLARPQAGYDPLFDCLDDPYLHGEIGDDLDDYWDDQYYREEPMTPAELLAEKFADRGDDDDDDIFAGYGEADAGIDLYKIYHGSRPRLTNRHRRAHY